ncbi:membrane-associated protein, putative, partial [Bodo saltans]
MVLVVAIIAAAVAFAPLYVASLDSATDSAESFSQAIALEIAAKVEQYFAVLQSLTTTMVTASHLGAWSKSDNASIVTWMSYGVTLGADSINMIFDGNIMWTASYAMQNNSNIQDGLFVLTKYNLSVATWYAMNITTLVVQEGPYYFASTLNFRNLQFYAPIRARQTWGAPYIGTVLGKPETVLPCGAPIVLPNGTSVGAFYVRRRTMQVVQYIRSLKIASTGRAMLVDPTTGYFIASNVLADPLVKNRTTGTGYLVTNYTDSTDPVIQESVRLLGSRLLTCSPLPCQFNVGSGNSVVYVTVAVVNDSYNLNKRLIVMIPSDDFLNKIRTAALTSIGALVGSVAGLVFLAFVAVAIIVRPLQRLENKLYASVTLEEAESDSDDNANDKSIFTEVLRIEEAYEKLQAELAKVKSFLPQSVLKQLEQQAAGDGAALEDDDDEGTLRGEDPTFDTRSCSTTTTTPSLDHTDGDAGGIRRQTLISQEHGGAHHQRHSSVVVSRQSASRTGSTQQTVHSRTSEERRQAIERGRTLNTNSGLTSRMCTVVMTNMDGLHR